MSTWPSPPAGGACPARSGHPGRAASPWTAWTTPLPGDLLKGWETGAGIDSGSRNSKHSLDFKRYIERITQKVQELWLTFW